MKKAVIGDATLYLADCQEVLPALDLDVDAMITNPPYEKEAHTAMRRTQKSIKSRSNDSISFPPMDDFTRCLVARWAVDHCRTWFLAFCQAEGIAAWREPLTKAGAKYKRAPIWVKPDSAPQFNGECPAQGYESMVLAWCGQGRSSWNGRGKRGVYTHNCNWPGRTGLHETEKPVPLMLELISDFTRPGDLIADPFMGIGSTGVAAVSLGRKFMGIEIRPDFFAVACRRIEEATHGVSLLNLTKPANTVQGVLHES